MSFTQLDSYSSFWEIVMATALWAAFIGLGISVGLLAAQSLYLKKKPAMASLVKAAVLGIAVGAAAGALAQIVFSQTSNISVPVEIVSRIICWGILGWGIGWGVSMFVPNYPRNRAMLAGFLGGIIGGAIFRASFVLPDPFSRIIGITILGLFIGLSISYLEEMLREAWLTIIWAQNETTTVSLGQKPVSFGPSREADVYVPQGKGTPPAAAVFSIENSKVVMTESSTGRRTELQNGSQVPLGRLSIVVNTKTEKKL